MINTVNTVATVATVATVSTVSIIFSNFNYLFYKLQVPIYRTFYINCMDSFLKKRF
jgi:hypothetical protein